MTERNEQSQEQTQQLSEALLQDVRETVQQHGGESFGMILMNGMFIANSQMSVDTIANALYMLMSENDNFAYAAQVAVQQFTANEQTNA